MTEVITNDENLVALIGGKDTLRFILEQFYGRLASDRTCQMLLSNFDIDILAASASEQIARRLGDTPTGTAPSVPPALPAAPQKVLARVSKHFEAALADSGVPENLRLDLTQAINPLKTLVRTEQKSAAVVPPPSASKPPARAEGRPAARAQEKPAQIAHAPAPQPVSAAAEERHAELAGQLAAISRSHLVAECTLDGTLVTANENFLRFVGSTLSEVAGKHHRTFLPQTQAASSSDKGLWEALRRGEAKTGQFQLSGKGGKALWMVGAYNPVGGAFGTPSKVMIVGWDCTAEVSKRLSTEQSLHRVTQSKEQLHSTALGLRRLSSDIRGGADDTRSRAVRLAQSATEVARNVGTAATGTEEMGVSIRAIAANAADAAQIATKAVGVTSQARETVGKLSASSSAIGNFVKVIKAIAEQTNLLALNATIEAARAGDAGRGFAVVAKEVKELAKETARATEEIAQRINEIQSNTNETTSAIAEIGSIIGSVNAISATIASSVEEQTATTNEIGRNIASASGVSAEISTQLIQLGSGAEQTAKGAHNLEQSVAEILRLSEELRP